MTQVQWNEHSGVLYVQLEAAHACFVVASEPCQGFSAEACMCLVGGNHQECPRTFTSPAALQRTEILEWARFPGTPALLLGTAEHHVSENPLDIWSHTVEGRCHHCLRKVCVGSTCGASELCAGCAA